MWKIILLSSCIACLLACKKNELTTSKLVIVNASYSLNSISARWNGVAVTSNPLAQAQHSGTVTNLYTAIPAGTSKLVLQNGSTTLLNNNVYAGAAGAYTLLVYDTSSAANSTRVVYLTDNLAKTGGPDTIFVRFLFCSPSDSNVDVIFLNSVKNDTIFKNVSSFGEKTIEKNIEQFTELRNQGITNIKINEAGSNIQLASITNFSFQQQSYYTILYSGLPGATGAAAPQLKVITHTH
jgi:hypothetical protein